MMKRLLSILLALALMLGCAASFAEVVEESPVLLVTVNGTDLTNQTDDLTYWISYYLYQIQASGQEVTDELLTLVNQYSLENAIAFTLIRQKAAEMGLGQFTAEEEEEMTATAREYWEEDLAYVMSMNGITEESTEEEKAAARINAMAEMEAEGYTEESYIAGIVENAKRNTLYSRVMESLTKDVAVTEEDIQTYFDGLVAEDQATYEGNIMSYELNTKYYGQESYYVPEGYRAVNHILLKVDDELLTAWQDLAARLEEQQEAEAAEATAEEAAATEEAAEGTAEEAPATEEAAEGTEAEAEPEEPVTQEMVDAAKQAILDSAEATVAEIYQKLQDGVPFEDLIAEYGEDPGMSTAESRAEGYPVHAESFIYDPAFQEAAMALEKVGDVSEPVLGSYGIHIIHYLKDVPAGAVELTDEMKAEIQEELMAEKEAEIFNEVMTQWRNEAEVVYTLDGEAWKLPTEEAAAE